MKKTIRKWVLAFVKTAYSLVPESIFIKLISITRKLGSDRFDVFAEFFSQIDTSILRRIGPPVINSFQLLNADEESAFKHAILDTECFEMMRLPVVHGLSEGGQISLFKKEITVFRFDRAEFLPCSDVIRIGDRAYWDKFTRPQFVKTIVQDKDVFRCDSKSGQIFLRQYPIGRRINVGFSLCGVHIESWGHFIGNFLPKIVALESIRDDSKIKVILPNTVDEHIRLFVGESLKSIGSYEIQYVKSDELVACERLYYCNSPSFIADHANYVTTADTQITNFSRNAIRRFSSNVVQAMPSFPNKRLFVGRRGGRSVINYEEVEKYFVSNGFEVVFPHLISFKDKLELFQRASHVCGPGSSGFSNIVFCSPGTKVLAFVNYARTQDAYAFALASDAFDFDIHLLTGTETPSADPHNSFSLSIEKIAEFLAKTNFLC